MNRTIASGLYAVAFGATLLATGCASYYKVTDPTSGKVYYTDKVNSDLGGAVKLKDARSKAVVTLQNSEVKEISKDEYTAGLAAPVTAPAPAAATPATTPATAAPAETPAAAPAAGTETK